MKVKCKERYEISSEDADGEVALCRIINDYTCKGCVDDKHGEGLHWKICDTCNRCGEPDVSENVELRNAIASILRNRINGLHITNQDYLLQAGLITKKRDYNLLLDGMQRVGKDKTYLRQCIYWLYNHSLIDEAKFNELNQQFELEGELTEGEQDAILEFAKREKI